MMFPYELYAHAAQLIHAADDLAGGAASQLTYFHGVN